MSGAEESPDPREVRPVRAWCTASGQEVTLRHFDEAKIRSRTIEYAAPNSIALSLSVAATHVAIAKRYFEEVLDKLAQCERQNASCHYLRHSEIYDYFEHLQIGVIFAYTAVESFANIAVPEQFTYERVSNRGIKEILSKENIERWCSTTEKLGVILPTVFDLNSPKQAKFWPAFKLLEELRNEIVHPKTKGANGEIPTDYLKRFFDPAVFAAIDAGRLAIAYFCENRTAMAYFPHIIGDQGPATDLTTVRGRLAEHVVPIEEAPAGADRKAP